MNIKKSHIVFTVLALSVIFCLLLIRSFIINSVSLPEAVDMRGESEISVVLREEGFVPDRVRVSAGTKVVFSTTRDRQFWPASNPHPAHTIYDAFDPQQPIASDETWTFVAEQDGVWGFHDHLRSYYTGILYVEAP